MHPPFLDPSHIYCRYAWECQTAEGGWGLDGVLREGAWKLRGIVNGIDTQEWSPERDSFLRSDGYENYSAANLREGKARCKAALQRVLHTSADHATAYLSDSLSMFSACMLLQRRPAVCPCHWTASFPCFCACGDLLAARPPCRSGLRAVTWA